MLRLSEDDERTYVGIPKLVSHGVWRCGRGMAEARKLFKLTLLLSPSGGAVLRDSPPRTLQYT